jgi:hypothetical protein
MENIINLNNDIIDLERQLNLLNSKIDISLFKRCYKCAIYKLKSDFHVVKGKHKRICKSCCSAYSKQYYLDKKNKKANKKA